MDCALPCASRSARSSIETSALIDVGAISFAALADQLAKLKFSRAKRGAIESVCRSRSRRVAGKTRAKNFRDLVILVASAWPRTCVLKLSLVETSGRLKDDASQPCVSCAESPSGNRRGGQVSHAYIELLFRGRFRATTTCSR